MASSAEFRLFGVQHLAALLVLAASAALIARAGLRGTDAVRRRLGIGLACLLLAYPPALYYQEARNGWLHLANSLPLQLCDLVLVACLAALLRPNALVSEIAYFWGLGGTLQAVLTPDIAQGFPSWRFLQFYWGHGAVLLGIVHMIAAQGFRPRPRSALRMFLALNIYGLTVLGLDLAFGWNYGYLLRKPEGSSLFDYLGPWPWYLFAIEGIALANFWLLGLPWQIKDRIHTRRSLPKRPGAGCGIREDAS